MRRCGGLWLPASRSRSARARAGSVISSAGSAGAPGTSKSGFRVFGDCSGPVVVPEGAVVVPPAGSVVVETVPVVVGVVSVVVTEVVPVLVVGAHSLTRTTRVP